MKYLSSTSSSLSAIQLATTLATVVGAFFVDFSLQYVIITVLSFYVYNIIGISLTLHRYYTHKSFEFKYDWMRKLFTLVAVLASRGSPIGWVYTHRVHHAKTDTPDDPHSPRTIGFKMFGFFDQLNDHEKRISVFMVKDLMNKEQLFITNYYVGIILVFVCLLSLIDVQLMYFVYALPIFLIHFSQVCFNYFGHKAGYRNFETNEHSTNNIMLWPFIWGDAWHNNHHAQAARLDTKIRWWEFDPIVNLVKVIEK